LEQKKIKKYYRSKKQPRIFFRGCFLLYMGNDKIPKLYIFLLNAMSNSDAQGCASASEATGRRVLSLRRTGMC